MFDLMWGDFSALFFLLLFSPYFSPFAPNAVCACVLCANQLHTGISWITPSALRIFFTRTMLWFCCELYLFIIRFCLLLFRWLVELFSGEYFFFLLSFVNFMVLWNCSWAHAFAFNFWNFFSSLWQGIFRSILKLRWR